MRSQFLRSIVMSFVLLLVTTFIDAGIWMLAWTQILVPIFHPHFVLHYVPACALDLIVGWTAMQFRHAGPKEGEMKEWFVDQTGFFIVSRPLMALIFVVMGWFLS